MRFEHKEYLWFLLVLIPGMILFLAWAWRRKKQLIGMFVQSRLLAHLTVGVSARRQKARMALLVSSAVLLIIVLARPQWGFEYEEARLKGLDIVVAIDTSKSMLAEDLAPNRLMRAKLAAMDLKKLARTDRVGLVAFAGSAFLQCPLSFDDEAFRQSIDALDTQIIPQGGTAVAEALQAARAAFKEKENHKIVVLFTDGEDHDGSALDVAKSAAKEGMRVYTIGVGTPNGELLRVKDARGRVDYVRDENGNVVKSRLDEKLLQEVSRATGGFYMLLSGANTMEMLYERELAKLPKTMHSEQKIKRYHERYAWFLGLAIICLVTEMFIPERKRISAAAAQAAVATTTNVELKKAIAVLVLIFFPAILWSSPRAALEKYNAKRYESARRDYEQALEKRPNDARLHFNAGASAFQARNYDKALTHFGSALATDDLTLQERAYYNLGNTEYRVGEDAKEPKEKQSAWEKAVTHYETALKLDPKDSDAQHNLEVVKRRLEELQKQQQDQKDDQNKDQDQNKEDKQKQDKQDQQEKKDQEQKSDQDKSQEQKPDQPKPENQEQQQQPKPQEQKPEEKQGQQQQGKKDDKDPGQEGNPAQQILMTPEQAMQLLDAQKGEERAMIFTPPSKTNRNNRIFKDW